MIEGKVDAGLAEFLKSKTKNTNFISSIANEESELFDIFQIRNLREEDFITHPVQNIPALKAEIKKSISQIIEKKALSHFTEVLQSRSKLQVLHFYKPDVDLNLYINNLKTNLEKILALKLVGDQYVGMLSKSYQEIRKKTKNFFTNYQYLGANQRASDFSSLQQVTNPLGVENTGFYFEESLESQQEKPLGGLFAGSTNWITAEQHQFNGFPNVSSKQGLHIIYIDGSINGASNDTITKYICFFQENRLNLDKMRGRLHLASQDFIEKLICNLFIQNELHTLEDPTNFFSVFVFLAGNPLNELRMLDIFLTLVSFDTSNAQALDIFNEHFKTKLEAKDLEKSRESFLSFVGMILEKYHKLTFSKRSGLDTDHFGKITEKAYSELGVHPFKSKLPSQSLSTMTSTDNYLEGYLKILSKSGYLGPKMNSFVQFCLNLTYKNFALDYFAGNQQMWTKIFDLVQLIACIDRRSGVAKKIQYSIADCLQNHQIFLNFVALMQHETDAIYQKITSKLFPVAQKLHSLTKTLPAYDNKIFDQLMREIADNTSLWQTQLLIQFLFGQLSNLSEEMRYLKEKNLINDNIVVYTKIQYLVSCVLEHSGLKRVFHLLANIITLYEKIRQSDPTTVTRVKNSLSHIFELTFNVYRTVRLQRDMNEKIDQFEFKASSSLSMQKSFHRVASKSEDEPQRNKSTGIEPNLSEFETGEEIKYEDLFMKLSTKAKHLLQEILSEGIEADISSKNSIYVQFPWLLSFAKKKDLFYQQLYNVQDNAHIQLYIRRDFILEDTVEQIEIFLEQHPPNAKLSRLTFKISFIGESGIDAGGLTNEWLTLVSKKLFDPSNRLFKLTSNKSTISPDPQSQFLFDYYSYFRLAGFLIGYVICQGKAIPVNFSHSFLKLILNRNIAINDLQSFDEDLMRSLDWMLKNSIDGVLEQEFSYELSLFDNRYKINLEESEENLDIISDSNKKQYVKRLIYSKLVKEIEPQVQAFKSTFHRFVNPDYLRTFLSSELDKLIAGEEKINFEDMKRTAQYNRGYNESSQQVLWFWEVVSKFDQEMLSNLWFFATGMSRVGINGFENKPLIVSRCGAALDSLPISHTCYHEIEIPEYQTKKELSEKLILAISEGNVGFAFS